MNYRYRLSGYVFETNIPIQELIGVNEDPDCFLFVRPDISGKIPAVALSLSSYNDPDLGLTCLQKSQIGFIAIWDKKILEYTPAPHLDEVGIRAQLLGTISMIMSAALGYISLHAASIVIDDMAVLFCGASGVGKSTLTAHFYSRGYQVLSDDVTTLRVGGSGKIQAYPSVPRIKLSDASLELIGRSNEGLSAVSARTVKYAVPFSAKEDNKSYNIRAIIFPSFRDGAFALENIEGFSNKSQISNHLYRKGAAKIMYTVAQKRELFLSLAANVPMYHFYRPCNMAAMQESLDYIEMQLNR